MIDRVLFSDNGTLSDISRPLAKYRSGESSFTFVATDDAIYIGSLLPFNHLYFKLGSNVNANASEVSIKTYNGSEFVPVVNIVDETAVSGASLAQSGFIQWLTDQNESWEREDTSNDGVSIITELGSVTIYDKYWLEIKFSNDLTAVDLQWLGQIFSDDDDLRSEYPDLLRSNVLAAFESGKTDWQEQHARAAELIAKDLVSKRIIDRKEQIVDRDAYKLASVSKVAELIFKSFGDDYINDRTAARQEYDARMNKAIYNVDKDKDARLDVDEAVQQNGWLNR